MTNGDTECPPGNLCDTAVNPLALAGLPVWGENKINSLLASQRTLHCRWPMAANVEEKLNGGAAVS